MTDAARHVTSPPRTPPSAAPPVTHAIDERAACGSSTSPMSDQNAETIAAPNTALCA
jgi:hypothetical protein